MPAPPLAWLRSLVACGAPAQLRSVSPEPHPNAPAPAVSSARKTGAEDDDAAQAVAAVQASEEDTVIKATLGPAPSSPPSQPGHSRTAPASSSPGLVATVSVTGDAARASKPGASRVSRTAYAAHQTEPATSPELDHAADAESQDLHSEDMAGWSRRGMLTRHVSGGVSNTASGHSQEPAPRFGSRSLAGPATGRLPAASDEYQRAQSAKLPVSPAASSAASPPPWFSHASSSATRRSAGSLLGVAARSTLTGTSSGVVNSIASMDGVPTPSRSPSTLLLSPHVSDTRGQDAPSGPQSAAAAAATAGAGLICSPLGVPPVPESPPPWQPIHDGTLMSMVLDLQEPTPVPASTQPAAALSSGGTQRELSLQQGPGPGSGSPTTPQLLLAPHPHPPWAQPRPSMAAPLVPPQLGLAAPPPQPQASPVILANVAHALPSLLPPLTPTEIVAHPAHVTALRAFVLHAATGDRSSDALTHASSSNPTGGAVDRAVGSAPDVRVDPSGGMWPRPPNRPIPSGLLVHARRSEGGASGFPSRMGAGVSMLLPVPQHAPRLPQSLAWPLHAPPPHPFRQQGHPALPTTGPADGAEPFAPPNLHPVSVLTARLSEDQPPNPTSTETVDGGVAPTSDPLFQLGSTSSNGAGRGGQYPGGNPPRRMRRTLAVSSTDLQEAVRVMLQAKGTDPATPGPVAATATQGDLSMDIGTLNVAALDRELLGLKPIGRGGGGIAFKAVWQGALVVVKFMLGKTAASVNLGALEGLLAASVSHPHVVQTYGFDVSLVTDACFQADGPPALAPPPSPFLYSIMAELRREQALRRSSTSGHGGAYGRADSSVHGGGRCLPSGVSLPDSPNTAASIEQTLLLQGNLPGRAAGALPPLALSTPQQALLAYEPDEVAVNLPQFDSQDGFGEPIEVATADSWSVAQVLESLKARPGMYLTYIIMEHCDRGTLLGALMRGVFSVGGTSGDAARFNQRVVLRAALRTARDVARGMQHLHLSDIIHGDLKPGNVLLRGSRNDRRGFIAKVADFGLSKVVVDDAPLEMHHWSTVTHMAPETLRGTWVKASDVYSFGVLLWQLVCGEAQPLKSFTVPQIIMGVSQGWLQLIWPPTAMPAVVKLGQACLLPNPAQRPSFQEIGDALIQIEQHVRMEMRWAQEDRGGGLGGAAAGGGAAASSARAVTPLQPPLAPSPPPQQAHEVRQAAAAPPADVAGPSQP